MEVSDIKSYHIRREVLEDWLKATFPGASVEVVVGPSLYPLLIMVKTNLVPPQPRDGEYSILAPRAVTQVSISLD